MLRVLSVVGTRPEVIKTLAFARAASAIPGLRFETVHSGQNFGPGMAETLWTELNIPVARSNGAVDRSTPGASARCFIDFVHSCLADFKPDVVISNTDTDTAFYAALAAARSGVKVAHIEGGIRCEARSNPEEINRRLADHLADWVFVISEDDLASLRAEGLSERNAFNLGDITLDALQIVLREHAIVVKQGDYDLLTIHRQENTSRPERLLAILEGVRKGGHRTLFPVHPRTAQALERPEIQAALRASGNIERLPPQGFLDMARLTAGCRKVISDSGGLRREGYMLGKPVIALVWFVWFKEMNRLGFELSADADSDRITRAIREFDPPGPRPPLFGDGAAGRKILEKLHDLL